MFADVIPSFIIVKTVFWEFVDEPLCLTKNVKYPAYAPSSVKFIEPPTGDSVGFVYVEKSIPELPAFKANLPLVKVVFPFSVVVPLTYNVVDGFVNPIPTFPYPVITNGLLPPH